MASLTLVSSSTSQWIFLAQATRTVNLFVVYSECVFVFSGNVALLSPFFTVREYSDTLRIAKKV